MTTATASSSAAPSAALALPQEQAALLLQQLFHGLSDRSRLLILESLRSDEKRVSELVAETGLSQPNVSKHLSCLWGCGLVAREKRGREVFYRAITGIDELLVAADRVLESAGETVGACPLTDETLGGCC